MTTVDRGRLARWAPAATVLGVVALTVLTVIVIGRSPQPSGPTTTLACLPGPSTEPVSAAPTSATSPTSAPSPTPTMSPPRSSRPPSPANPPDCPPAPSPTSSSTLPRPTATPNTPTPPPPSTCSDLIDHAGRSGPLPDQEAVAAALLDTLRRAGLAGQPSTAGHPKLEPSPSEVRFDVSDAGGPGGIRIEVSRYLDSTVTTPDAVAGAHDCLRARFPQGGRLGDGNPMPDVRRLPGGGTVIASDCAITAGTRGCAQILYGATGLRIEVGAYLWAFSTDTGGTLPPVTRTTMPLTVDEMLALTQAIDALG